MMSLRCSCGISGFVRNKMVLVKVASQWISLQMIGSTRLCILGSSVGVCILTGCLFHCPKLSLPGCKEIVAGISVLTLVMH
jgi:hypothetical protein